MADVTIAAETLVNYHEVGTLHELRLFSDRSWTASDDTPVPGRGNNDTYYASYTLTANTTLFTAAIPSVTVKSNQDALNTVGKVAKWTAQVFVDGVPRDVFMPNVLGAFTVPSSPAGTTWGALETYNSVRRDIPASPHPTLTQVQNLINIGLGTLNNASVGVLGRIETATAPLDPAHPKAVETGDPRLPGFVLYTSKYASLNAALTAITSLGGGTVVIDSSTPVTSNVATTASIALRFEGQGILTGASKTVTVNGAFICPPGHRALASGITADFTTNTVQKFYSVDWWGAAETAAGAATSAALNAAFASLPFGAFILLNNVNYQNAGFTIDHKAQITVLGNQSLDGYIDPGWGPRFTYVGTDGGNHITLNNVYGSTFQGFLVYGAATDTVPGTTGAAKNIWLTMTPGGSPPISSQNVFQSLKVQPNNSRSDYRGIDISNASGTNNEFSKINNCKIYGGLQGFGLNTGIGLYIGHSNVKHVIINNSTFGGCATAIFSASGSFRAYSPTFDANTAIVAGSVTDGSFIIGADGENNTQVINGLSGSGTITFGLLYSRFDNMLGGQSVSAGTTDDPVIDSAVFHLVVEGCNFSANTTFTSDFLSNAAGAMQGSIGWRNNNVYNFNSSSNQFPDSLLVAGLNSFLTWTTEDEKGYRAGGSRVGSGVGRSWVSFDGVTSTNAIAKLIGIQGDPVDAALPSNQGLFACAQNSVCLGAGEIEIAGLRPATSPILTIAGTPGAVTYQLSIVALDASGNRTFLSYPTSTATANATLSGTNKIVATFPAVAGAASYDILRSNPADGTQWGLIANQAAAGTGVQTYNVITNFAGPYTYTLPTYNATATLKFRGASTFNNASPIAFASSSPAQITANVNNWNPAPTAPFASTYIRLTTDVSRNITGMAFTKTQTDGQTHVLVNIGLADAVIKHQSASSTAANRFFCSTAADITLTPKQAADVIYDLTNGYWLVFKRS